MEHSSIRYSFVDGIRGLAIANMVIFHFFYDVFIIYGKNQLWYECLGVHIWQQMICQTFIFISGFVWQWGKSGNLWRGTRLNLYGLLISFITFAVIPSEAIWFGILNFMGCAILLMFLFQKAMRKIPPVLGFGICFLLFVFCKRVPYGYLGIGDCVKIPDLFYSVKILMPFGFPFPGYSSSDYFPIIPWMFLYLCGYFFYGIFQKRPAWQTIAHYRIPFFSAVGTKAIWIYLLHQPVNLLICRMIFGSL